MNSPVRRRAPIPRIRFCADEIIVRVLRYVTTSSGLSFPPSPASSVDDYAPGMCVMHRLIRLCQLVALIIDSPAGWLRDMKFTVSSARDPDRTPRPIFLLPSTLQLPKQGIPVPDPIWKIDTRLRAILVLSFYPLHAPLNVSRSVLSACRDRSREKLDAYPDVPPHQGDPIARLISTRSTESAALIVSKKSPEMVRFLRS